MLVTESALTFPSFADSTYLLTPISSPYFLNQLYYLQIVSWIYDVLKGGTMCQSYLCGEAALID